MRLTSLPVMKEGEWQEVSGEMAAVSCFNKDSIESNRESCLGEIVKALVKIRYFLFGVVEILS